MLVSKKCFLQVINESEYLKEEILLNLDIDFDERHLEYRDVSNLYQIYILIKGIEKYYQQLVETSYQDYQKEYKSYPYVCDFRYAMSSILELAYDKKFHCTTSQDQDSSLYAYIFETIDTRIALREPLFKKCDYTYFYKYVTKSEPYKLLKKQLDTNQQKTNQLKIDKLKIGQLEINKSEEDISFLSQYNTIMNILQKTDTSLDPAKESKASLDLVKESGEMDHSKEAAILIGKDSINFDDLGIKLTL